jgi:hypothetical protein
MESQPQLAAEGGMTMIGSVFEAQQQLADLAKRRSAPAAPQPDHIAWARDVMAQGYQASTPDRADAQRILEEAGIDSRESDAAHEDTAPPGAREVAAAVLAREQAEEGQEPAQKAFADRGIHLGPGEGAEPGKPRPEQHQRGYLAEGHGAESPQSTEPRENPMPAHQPGIVSPVALPHADVQVQHADLPTGVRAGYVPQHIASTYALGSPSER